MEGITDEKLSELIIGKLREMMDEDPVKLMQYFVVVAGRSAVQANAETLTLSSEATIEGKRWHIENVVTVKEVTHERTK